MNRLCSVALLFSLSLLLHLPPVVTAGDTGDVQVPYSPQLSGADITVNFLGEWDPGAQAAVDQAMQTWAETVFSTVPIEVDVQWGFVWQGTPAAVYSSYTHSMSLPDTTAYYPEPLSNALQGADYSADADFIIRFNSDIAGWYFGLDGQGSEDEFDLRTVALKYGGIGLGFASSMGLCGPSFSLGCWGFDSGPDYPLIYDKFMVNGDGQSLLDETLFPDESEVLGNQLKSDNVYFDGAHAVAANGGAPPKLYAPADWSTVRHAMLLDDDAFAPGTLNALMTHSLAPGEVIHDPGPVAIAILHDMGWPVPQAGPEWQPLPELVLQENTVHTNAVDLWQFVSDADTPVEQLSFMVTDVTARQIGLTFDGRYISFAPHADWTGPSTVTVQATDSTNLAAEASFDVYVVEEDEPPVGPQWQPLPELLLQENTVYANAVDLWQFVSDADTPVEQLSFLIIDVSAHEIGLTFDGSRYISFAPHADWTGHATVTVQVTDDTDLTDSTQFDVYVEEQLYSTLLPLFVR